MESIKGFLSWWIGELTATFSGRRGPILALVLTEQEIALIERGNTGEAPLGVAALDAPDRRERIEALRSIAEKRGGEAIELRLPLGQVFFLELPKDTPSDDDTIAKIAAREVGHPAADLSLHTVTMRNEGNEAVLLTAGVLRATLAEALRYARDWGFDPVRVTSVEWPSAFNFGPELYLRPMTQRATMMRRLTLGLAMLAVVIGAAAGARALGTRAAIAETEARSAAALPRPKFESNESLRGLVSYSDAAAAAVDARTEQMPLWSLFAEVARILPADMSLDTIRFRNGSLRLVGTGYALDQLVEALDNSPYFIGPQVMETRARGKANAQFEIEVMTVVGGTR